MKILVAGATGAIGRQLVPMLVERGHDVAGVTRTPEKAGIVRSAGARPIVADALDASQVADAVGSFEPEVIVHELTALRAINFRRFAASFAETNRFRTEATDHLLAAGRAVGVRRFVAQSYAGWPFERRGSAVKTEDAPLDPDPAAAMRESLAAIRHAESAVLDATWTEGVVLRYGNLYGPGTGLDGAEGESAELVRRRQFPIVGNGAGIWSFVHVTDAAEATVIAAERGPRGVYQIVDDEPASVSEWLPALAAALGAPSPRRVPRWLGRLVAGEAVTVMMTEVRGASNERAKRVLGWRPRHASWRDWLGRAELERAA